MHIKDLTKQSFYVLIIRSAGILILLSFTLFITNFFSATDVGRYDFVRSTLNFLGGLTLMGTNQSIIYYSGILKARNSMQSIKSIYIKMLRIIFLISFFVFFVFFLLDERTINQIFKSEESYSLIFKTSTALLFFALTILNIDTIRALKKTIISEFIRSIFRYIPVFLFVALIYNFDFNHLIVEAYLLGFVFLSFVSTFYTFSCFKKIKQTNKSPEKFSSKEIILTSAPMAISAIAYFIMQSIDIIILSIYEGFEQIAYYSVSVKLATLTALALMSVNIVIAPRIAEAYELNDINKMQNLIKNASRIIFVISACILTVLFFFSNEALSLFGAEYKAASYALVLLLAAQCFNSFSGPGSVYLNMTGRQNILNKILILGLLVNIILNFYFIPVDGINGAAKATLISLVFWNALIVIFVYYNDRIKIFLN